MNRRLEIDGVSKRYGETVALDDVLPSNPESKLVEWLSVMRVGARVRLRDALRAA